MGGNTLKIPPPNIYNTDFRPQVPIRADIGFFALISTIYFCGACPELAG
jgi:hypothetical protein